MAQAGAAAGGDTCLRCGSSLRFMGVEEFRSGGMVGGWKLFFDQWGELDETLVPFEVWACPSCRRVELRVAPPKP